MALVSVEQEAQVDSGVSGGSDVCTGMWTCGTFALCCSCEHSGKYSQCGSPSLLQTQPFCVLPAIPSYRGYLQAGNQAQKYGCHGASVSF